MYISSDYWVHIPEPNEQATMRFFCFPHGGGDASVYYTWQRYLPASVELCALQLPARENGPDEKYLAGFTPLVTGLADAIEPFLDRPYAFFSHSNGVLIEAEVARLLAARHCRLPDRLFFSAYPALHLIATSRITKLFDEWLDLPDQEVYERCRAIGLDWATIPAFSDPEVRSFVMGMLRKDREACADYVYKAQEPFRCSLTILGAKDDSFVPYEELAAWEGYTTERFSIRMLPGNHPYIYTNRDDLLAVLSEELEQVSIQ